MQGLILINKPTGITSFGACARIRRLANEKRVGHTGTLDPLATGVLPVLIGKATALSSYLSEADKFYRATIKFGITTDTDDITGNVITETHVSIDTEKLNKALKCFVGKQMQVPPSFSAIKQNGVPMYKLARKNEEVNIPPREITVYSITPVTEFCDNEITVDVKCSKGTYIRSLCRDIGEFLGCGATMSALERRSAAGFDIENTVSFSELTNENIGRYILPAETAVMQFGMVEVSPKQAVRFANGGELFLDRLTLNKEINDGEILRVKYNDVFIGLGCICIQENLLMVKCVINNSFEV